MSQLHVESNIVSIPHCDEKIFAFVSDMRNFEGFLPDDVTEKMFEENSCSFSVKGQKAMLRFVDKEPFKTLKISSNEIMMQTFNMWIQLKPLAENSTAVKLTVKAEVNLFIKNMMEKPVKEMLDTLAEKMKSLPY